MCRRAIRRRTARACSTICRGIEVGHVFQLGTKYSDAMGATFLDENGKPQPMQMGCYGIGVTRILGAAIEQNFDDKGIIWPESIAPFEVVLCPMGYDRSDAVREQADKLYATLLEAGIDVILDDRGERPGVMFADWELIGVPHRLVIGDRGLKEGKLEYQGRRDAEATLLPVEDAAQRGDREGARSIGALSEADVEYNFLSATVLLILITDPLGNIPIFINACAAWRPSGGAIVILREVAIAFGDPAGVHAGRRPLSARDEPDRSVVAARRRDRAVPDRAPDDLSASRRPDRRRFARRRAADRAARDSGAGGSVGAGDGDAADVAGAGQDVRMDRRADRHHDRLRDRADAGREDSAVARRARGDGVRTVDGIGAGRDFGRDDAGGIRTFVHQLERYGELESARQH